MKSGSLTSLSRRALGLGLAMSFLIPGCGDDEPDLSPKTPSWTIGIYMSADNNLDPAASADLRELLSHGVPEDDVVMVYIDRAEPDDYRPAPVPGVSENGQARYLTIRLTEVVEEELLGELNSNDVDTLHAFADRVLASPTDHHALILWDHGGPTSFGVDKADGGGMNLVNLDHALREDTTDDTSTPLRFDILGVDACLMASGRALERLAPHADFYVASAELEPGPGWDYYAFMEHLSRPDMDPRTLAGRLVDSYVDYYRSTGKAGSLPAGLIAIDTALAPDLFAKAQTVLASYRSFIISDGYEPLFDALQVAVNTSQAYNARADQPPSVIDAGGYIASIMEDPNLPAALRTEAEDFLEALEAATVNHAHLGSNAESRGLSFMANDVGATPAFGDSLADVFGDVTDEAILNDDAPPGVSMNLLSVQPGELGDVARVTYAATDAVGLTRVSVGAAILESGGQYAQVLSQWVAQQEGLKSVDGDVEFALGTIALSNDAIEAGADQAGFLYRNETSLLAPARLYRDGFTVDAVLILNDDLTISSVAIEDENGGWAVFEWELVKLLGFDISLLSFRYDLSDLDNPQTLVRTRYPAADMNVEFFPIEDSRLNVYVVARDVAGSRLAEFEAVN